MGADTPPRLSVTSTVDERVCQNLGKRRQSKAHGADKSPGAILDSCTLTAEERVTTGVVHGSA